MQFFRKLFSLPPISAVGKRNFAQVHDIQIKVNDRVLGSMERNGTLHILASEFVGETEEETCNVIGADGEYQHGVEMFPAHVGFRGRRNGTLFHALLRPQPPSETSKHD